MGFQGDVAGIGLGELLQGLARGGREGVLTLRGGSYGATVGLQGGQLFLLPEPDEDPEIWRKRCKRAWVKDPNERIDVLRMSEIAYAARLESMFLLLDSEGVHFRFEPGPLPEPTTPEEPAGEELALNTPLDRIETGTRKVQIKVPVHCPGVSVEFLLLEYARLSDECQQNGNSNLIPVHDVPRLLTGEAPTPGLARFWEECDGMSNLVEMADRLGTPIRQCRATVQGLWAGGHIRLADARELLVLAQKELIENRFARAASRLSGWVVKSPPGPAPVGDVQLLLAEWAKGKLPAMLASMDAREARVLLRRLEFVERDIPASIVRWKKHSELHRHDAIGELRLLKWQLATEDEADAPAISELLRVARKFQDLGQNTRAGVMLRGAAAQMPENTALRLELGQRMIAVDLVEEGGSWIVEACRTLIASGLSEKSVAPLRALVAADPGNREARAMLGMARKRSVSGKRYRRNTVVALAVLLALSLVALVKVQLEREVTRKLDNVRAAAERPRVALALLDDEFADDPAEPVQALRRELLRALLAEEDLVREQWLAGYRDVQHECTHGDPLRGLERALGVPEPPVIEFGPSQDWPRTEDLLDDLASRLEQAAAIWGPPREGEEDQLEEEQRLAGIVSDLRAQATKYETTRALENFSIRMEVLASALVERDTARDEERRELFASQRLERQNRLLKAARRHAAAGELEQAVRNFRELVTMEDSAALARALAPEIEPLETHWAAVVEARRLCEAGQHAKARLALARICPDPVEHPLPGRLETWPSGGRVELPDGTVGESPLVLECGFGQHVELRVTLAGHEPYELAIDGPQDLMLYLSRLADRRWSTGSRVEALPLAIEDDHVCADRGGNVIRLRPGGEPAWRASLDTLGGIARTLAPLPRSSDSLLAIDEDGGAWLIDAANGSVEGPWSHAEPPRTGPTPGPDGATVTYADGTVGTWESSLEPLLSRGEVGTPDKGSDAGLAVLRRTAAGGTALASPWSPYVITVFDDHYEIHWEGRENASFTARRTGDWEYMAWEPPTAELPAGRLWISDGSGLRAFRP